MVYGYFQRLVTLLLVFRLSLCCQKKSQVYLKLWVSYGMQSWFVNTNTMENVLRWCFLVKFPFRHIFLMLILCIKICFIETDTLQGEWLHYTELLILYPSGVKAWKGMFKITKTIFIWYEWYASFNYNCRSTNHLYSYWSTILINCCNTSWNEI